MATFPWDVISTRRKPSTQGIIEEPDFIGDYLGPDDEHARREIKHVLSHNVEDAITHSPAPRQLANSIEYGHADSAPESSQPHEEGLWQTTAPGSRSKDYNVADYGEINKPVDVNSDQGSPAFTERMFESTCSFFWPLNCYAFSTIPSTTIHMPSLQSTSALRGACPSH
jgi:hypothetical protein